MQYRQFNDQSYRAVAFQNCRFWPKSYTKWGFRGLEPNQPTIQYSHWAVHVIYIAFPESHNHLCCVVVPNTNPMKPISTLVLFLWISALTFAQETILSSSSKTHTYTHNNGYSSFSIETRGKIILTDDDKDVKSISADGYLEINKTVFGSRRSLVITPSSNGVKREYYEGRTNLPFEPNGRKWMEEILAEIVRTTTLGAEGRVNRFYRQGGYSSVLNEIDKLESDHVKAFYANALMDMPLTAKDYPAIISRATQAIESDHYNTEFLRDNLGKFLQTKEATDAVFAASARLESDHYKTVVIQEALRKQAASPEAVRSILMAASKIESDHYKTEVLTSLLKQDNVGDAVIAEMINATKTIDSDHYRTVVLTKALSKQGLSSVSYQRALESVRDIESDHYKTQVITGLLDKNLSDEQLFNLVDISGSIESDHYLSIVFRDALATQNLSATAFEKLIERASLVESDHYASQILIAALGSPSLGNDKLIDIIKASGNINSDHYISEVLLKVAPRVKTSDAAVREAYRATAKKIESETYYGRVARAID